MTLPEVSTFILVRKKVETEESNLAIEIEDDNNVYWAEPGTQYESVICKLTM